MRTYLRLLDCHQTVQECHLLEYQLCMLFHATRHDSLQCTSHHLPHYIHRRDLHTHWFVDPCHSMKLHFRCEARPRRVQTGQNCQLHHQISWLLHLLLPAQHHPTVCWRFLQDAQISNFCQCVHPQRLLCHSWPTQMQTHPKSNLKFQAAKYLKCFRAESPRWFRYLKRSVLGQLSSIALWIDVSSVSWFHPNFVEENGVWRNPTTTEQLPELTWDQPRKIVLTIIGMRFFWDTKCFFRDTENVLDIFGGQRGLTNCLIVLESKLAMVGFNGRRPKKQPQKQQNAAAHKRGKAAQRSRSSNINRKSKMQQHKQQKAETTGKSAQTTRAAQAEASCTNNKEHQTATTREEQQHKQQQKQHKQQQKQRTKRNIISNKCSTSSSKSCTNTTNSSENSKSSNRERSLFVFSVASSRGISVFPGFLWDTGEFYNNWLLTFGEQWGANQL